MANDDSLISESMEMYLVTIARLRKGKQPVPLSQLAEALSVTPVSVNEMCRKLQESGLLIYRPYKGAALTDTGEGLANHVLRRHRLWEVFLVEKLNLGYEDAHDAACELEHVTTNALIDKLDEFLGFPKVDINGQTIPTSQGIQPEQISLPLLEMRVGSMGHIVRCDVPEQLQLFLQQQGIRPGVILMVIASGDDSILVEVNDKQTSLSSNIASNIYAVISSPGEIMNEIKGSDEKNNNIEQERDEVNFKMESDNEAVAVEQFPLSELEKGQKAVIVQVGGKGAVKRRMMDMGVVPGSEISVVRIAPFGDPIEFSIKGYSLSLRKSEANEIMVEMIE